MIAAAVDECDCLFLLVFVVLYCVVDIPPFSIEN